MPLSGMLRSGTPRIGRKPDPLKAHERSMGSVNPIHTAAQHAESRVFGLDLLRALAIALVFVGHGFGLFFPQHIVWVYRLLPDGVALFFCLSGYLITVAFLGHLQKWGTHGSAVFHFWLKRAIRTIPPFFMALIIHGLLIAALAADSAVPASPLSFVFLQNFAWPLKGGFTEGWSLSVEEWFYALFMLLAAVGFLWRKNQLGVFAVAACALLTATVAYRASVYGGAWGALDLTAVATWSASIQTTVLGRLDAPAIGVLFAVASRAWPQAWDRLAASTMFLVGGVVAVWGVQNFSVLLMVPASDALAACAAGAGGPNCFSVLSSQWFFAVQPTLVSLAWALLLAPASRMTPPRWAACDAVVRQIAASAFSIYLVHFSIVAFLLVPALNRFWPASGAADLAAYVVMGAILSQVFFVLVERPALVFRKRIDVWFKPRPSAA